MRRIILKLALGLTLAVLAMSSTPTHTYAWPLSSTTTVKQTGYVMRSPYNSPFAAIVRCDDAWILYDGVWHQGSITIKYSTTSASNVCEATFNGVPVNRSITIEMYATSTGYTINGTYRTRIKTSMGTTIGKPAAIELFTLPNTSFFVY
jgi:hypothetical protein